AVYAALPESSRIQFLSGYLLSDLGRGAVFLVLAVIAAAAGVYWGWQVAIPEEAVLEETSISPERRRK
ncbi:MAG TPA: hypothetical protein VNO70_10775, partial [Blastocatellia bacterium]|nr:hypothetical protein [Blastocatellia bacterium]